MGKTKKITGPQHQLELQAEASSQLKSSPSISCGTNDGYLRKFFELVKKKENRKVLFSKKGSEELDETVQVPCRMILRGSSQECNDFGGIMTEIMCSSSNRL